MESKKQIHKYKETWFTIELALMISRGRQNKSIHDANIIDSCMVNKGNWIPNLDNKQKSISDGSNLNIKNEKYFKRYMRISFIYLISIGKYVSNTSINLKKLKINIIKCQINCYALLMGLKIGLNIPKYTPWKTFATSIFLNSGNMAWFRKVS